ncbi:MAG: ATP-binding protein [Candidatus Anstonellales archaeon]
MEVGFVISQSDIQGYSFLVSKDAKLDNNVFVITDSGIFGRVVNIANMNNLLMDQDVLIYYDGILKHVAPQRENYSIARVKIYGYVKDNRIDRVNSPPKPGDTVRVVDWNELKRLFGLEESDQSISIGYVLPYEQEFYFDPYRLVEKHFGVLAMSGAGKSNMVTILLQEFTQRGIDLPIVVFDIHNEYYNFSQIYPDRFVSIKSGDIKLSGEYINTDVISSLIEDLSETQFYILDSAISRLDSPSIDNLLSVLRSKDDEKRSVNALIRKILHIRNMDIFGEIGLEEKIGMLKYGKSLIIDFSDSTNDRILSTKAYVLLKELFERRKRGEIPPVLVIVEEAHLLASNETNTESRLSQLILTRIAREGRKFGLCLGIISQRPYYLNQTIMAQLNVQIFLRIVNPYDLEYVKSVSEQLTEDDISSIPNLLPGEAIVSGLLKYPLFVRFKLADSKLRSNYTDLRNMVDRYWEVNGRKRYLKDIDF